MTRAKMPTTAGMVLALLPVLAAAPAHAAQPQDTLSVVGGKRQTVRYACGGQGTRTVTYVNGADDSLAIVAVDGASRIFVDVIAASGARYVAGRYVWWTKGAEASLYDVMRGPDAEPVAVCHEHPG